jgi:hypothetical protein
MEETVKIQLNLPKEVNYKLNLHMAKIKLREKRSKANEIIRLMQIGLQTETKNQ